MKRLSLTEITEHTEEEAKAAKSGRQIFTRRKKFTGHILSVNSSEFDERVRDGFESGL